MTSSSRIKDTHSRFNQSVGLTQYASEYVCSVVFKVVKGRHAHHEFVEQASKGPEVGLPTVLLLEKEFWGRVLQSAEEGSRLNV